MDCTGTKMADANVKGKISGNVMAWAVSEFGAARPTNAKPHDKQYAKTSMTTLACRYGKKL